MKHVVLGIVLGLLTVSSAAWAVPKNKTPFPPLLVKDAYAFATSPAQKNGVALFTVSHHGEGADAIVAVKSDIAKKTELHTHIMEGDVMEMRPIEEIPLPYGTPVVLNPMGDHVMLMGLKKQLKIGDVFQMTLQTEKGLSQTFDVTVKAPE